MKWIECPNCGAHDLEGRCCAYCGSELLTETEFAKLRFRLERRTQDECGPDDLDYYYYTYRPDRSRAIVAMRIDTGVSPQEARSKIDLIFDYYEQAESRV